MLAAHDLINPTFNYLPRFNKPVLSYWIVAAFYKALGVSVAVQRIPIALGGLILIGCAAALAWLADARPAGERGAFGSPALWAAIGLAVDPRLVMFARRIFIDIWISVFLALTLTFYLASERYPDRRRSYLLLMYVSAGLGVLTKGPIAVVLPALAFGLYLVAHRDLGRLKTMMIPAGVLVVSAIVLPWYAALYHQHGWSQIKSFLVTENVERFTEGTGVRQTRGLLFYLPVLFSDSLPWSAFLIAAAITWWRRRDRLESLLWCWILTIVGFFSLSAGKQDLYIFPVAPAVAATGGLMLSRVSNTSACRLVRRTLAVVGVLLTLVGAGVFYVFDAGGRVYAIQGATAVAAVIAAGGMTTARLSRRPLKAAATLAASLLIVDWIFVLRVLPDFERYKPVPSITATLRGRLQPDDAVANYQVALPSLVYYLGRHVDEYFDEPAFVAAVEGPQRLYAVLSDDDYRSLAPRIGARTCIIDRHPTFNVKLGSVLARDPLPELLVISNGCR